MAAVLVLIGATAIVQGRAQDAAATAALGWENTVFPGDAQGDGVQQVAFSPDDKTLAAVSDAGTAVFWDPATGQTVDPALTAAVNQSAADSVAVSPDGATIAVGYSGGTVQLWNQATARPVGQPLALADRQRNDLVTSMDFTPDGKTLAAGSSMGAVQIWVLADQAGISPQVPRRGRSG
ncbi:MAG TPA: hypothetical protein VGX23_21310 [Actinocrinis sp.]|nr:hypothetical protein [Actinocrinis sp.]